MLTLMVILLVSDGLLEVLCIACWLACRRVSVQSPLSVSTRGFAFLILSALTVLRHSCYHQTGVEQPNRATIWSSGRLAANLAAAMQSAKVQK